MLITRVTQILSVPPKRGIGLYLFLNTHFSLKYLWGGLEAAAGVCFSCFLLQEFLDGFKNAAVSSSAASQEHGAALESRARQERPCPRLPAASRFSS